MANIIEYDTVTIGSHYVCALEYGDYSGLDDKEEGILEQWLKQFKGKYVYFQYSEDSHFERCAIGGLYADCVDCTILIDMGH